MPPQPSLPIRDGGFEPNSSSSVWRNSQLGDAYYSNEDIILLNDIVTLGEKIYPTLPERDRLPTNALFQAAEQVLPAYGYDPDDAPPHISRLIFKIGGHRAGITLGEKFRSILGGMGIELEFVPSSPVAGQLSRSGSSPIVRYASAPGSDDATASPQPAFLSRAAPRQLQSSLSESSGLLRNGNGTRPARKRHNLSVSFEDSPLRDDERTEPSVRDAVADGDEILHDLNESRSTIEETNRVHLSLGSHDGSGVFRGASDTTVQTPETPEDQEDQDLPPYPEEVNGSSKNGPTLESKLALFQRHDSDNFLESVFSAWSTAAQEAQATRDEQDYLAADEDEGWAVFDAMDAWKRASRSLAKKERRCLRAYKLCTMYSVVDHWQLETQEEVDRTAVARRHLVRKRTFDGWCAQHAEDEWKVHKFTMTSFLRRWGRATLETKVRGREAIREDEEQLLQDAVQKWSDLYRGDLADDLYTCRLAEQSVDTWSAAAHAIAGSYTNATTSEQRDVLADAVAVWYDETADLTSTAYDRAVQKYTRDCHDIIQQWHVQAKLSKLLKQFSDADKERLLRNSLGIWQLAARETTAEDEAADRWFLNAPLRQWNLETKAQLFRQYDEEEKLSALFHRWALEERLCIFKRYAKEKSVASSLDAWHAAALGARATRLQEEALATKVDNFRSKESAVDDWLNAWDARKEVNFRHEYNSDVVLLVRKTRPYLDRWRRFTQKAVQRTNGAYRAADQADYEWTTDYVMDQWPAVARASWEERITRIYHSYRRRQKAQMAADCLRKWSAAAADARAYRNEADDFYIDCERDDVAIAIDYWNSTSKTADYLSEVATAAELEYHTAAWIDRAGDAEENEMDAADYDMETTAARYVKDWEFAVLQLESVKPGIKALQEKNNKRLCRQLIDEWHQKAVPEAAHMDTRLSMVMSRRSTRQQRRFATSLHETTNLSRAPSAVSLSASTSIYPYRPRDTATLQPTTRTFRPGASSLSEPPQTGMDTGLGLELGPMAEFDEESLAPPDDDNDDPVFMSTPSRRPIGSARRPTTTPSAILPSPKERELRRGYSARSGQVKFASIWEDSAEDYA